MARAAMTVRQRPSAYSVTPLDLSALDTFNNADGMTLPATGDIAVMFLNDTGTSKTLTVHSAPDPGFARSKDITTYSIANGHYVFLQEFPATGWATGGVVNIDASGAIKYAAIKRA